MYSMSDHHKNHLQKCRVALVKYLMPTEEFFIHLLEDHTLTEDMHQSLQVRCDHP